MGISNSGTDVLVDASGISLSGFTNAAASNVKIIDNVYQITSNAAGGSTNGTIALAKSSGAVANLKTSKVFQTQAYPKVNAGSASDSPVSNMYLDLQDATLICTGSATVSEIIAPMKMNEFSKVVWSGGSWNSIHPGTQIDGSTIVFTGSTDCHLGFNPAGYVKNVRMVCLGTSNSDIIMAGQPVWTGNTSADKPVPMDGFSFTSVSGNVNIMVFTWGDGSTQNTVPWGQPNNAFMIYRDFGYNVGSGSRLTSIKRAYRRSAISSAASSVWGSSTSISMTYIWVDAYTSLDASGVLSSTKTYIKQADYNVTGTTASATNSDLFAFRFSPTFTNASGVAQSSVNVTVINTNANATSASVGDFRAKISASGTSGSNGKISISEPATKDYTTNSSHRTDSICVKNRVATGRFHKFWEAGVKYIVIGDSRGSTGTTFGDVYADNDFVAHYRKPGFIFISETLALSAPIVKGVTLAVDSNYNSSASVAGISVSHSGSVTTVNISAITTTLDSIYRAIIDYHADISRTEGATTIPVDQSASGILSFGSNLSIVANTGTVVNEGINVKSVLSTSALSVDGKWDVAITDSSGTKIKLTASEGNFSSYVILADSTGTYSSPSPLGTSDDLGWVANAASRDIVVPSGKTFYVYSIVYGYQPKVTYVSTVQNTVLNHVPEPQVNTSLDTTERDAIVAKISHSLDSAGDVKLTVSSTMADKTPEVALNGLHRFIFINGSNFALLSTLAKSAAGVQLKADGVKVFTTKFYGTPADSITPSSAPDTGIVMPLHFENLTGDSSYKILRKNVNDVPLTGALWVRAEASVGNETQNAIAVKAQTLIEGSTVIAKEVTVSALASSNINANVVQINGIAVSGSGTREDPWGPEV